MVIYFHTRVILKLRFQSLFCQIVLSIYPCWLFLIQSITLKFQQLLAQMLYVFVKIRFQVVKCRLSGKLRSIFNVMIAYQKKTTSNYSIRIAPYEIKTIHGIARRTGEFDTAVTEHMDTSLPGDLTICPRVVSLKGPGNTARVPIRVCNLSARVINILPKSFLYSVNSVSIVDSWTPSSKKPEKVSTESTLEDLGISIEIDNLSADQLHKVKEVLCGWSDIFPRVRLILGRLTLSSIRLN